jgi:hypothetical protein
MPPEDGPLDGVQPIEHEQERHRRGFRGFDMTGRIDRGHSHERLR